MKKSILLIVLSLFVNLVCIGQKKVNADSILTVAYKQLNVEKKYPKAKALSLMALKSAPGYLDFHLLLGRVYAIEKQTDSARYYFNYVINRNPRYKEAFSYLIKLEIEQKNKAEAISVIDKALTFYQEDKEFFMLKLEAIKLEEDDNKTIEYLVTLQEKYPDDKNIKQELVELRTKTASNRVGVNYSLTQFDRDGVGPWHLIAMQYVRERKNIALIGRISYINRLSFGNSVNSGVQYEFETYFLKHKTNYSYAEIALSNDNVFPKLRLAYSYFQSFNKGWEGDLGMRYTKTTNNDIYTAVLGAGKYVGAYWLNMRSFLQFTQGKMYPAISINARYYLNTKYDYISAATGYGTSPDERTTLGQFDDRFTLHSYRIGAGYNRILWNNYIFGVQTTFNRQEYNLDKYQSELNLSLSAQYKF